MGTLVVITPCSLSLLRLTASPSCSWFVYPSMKTRRQISLWVNWNSRGTCPVLWKQHHRSACGVFERGRQKAEPIDATFIWFAIIWHYVRCFRSRFIKDEEHSAHAVLQPQSSRSHNNFEHATSLLDLGGHECRRSRCVDLVVPVLRPDDDTVVADVVTVMADDEYL